MLALLAALFAAAALAVLVPCSARLGLLDRPGGHKQHAAPVPAVGGIALFTALVLAWLVARRDPADGYLLLGSALLLAVGVWDDRRSLRARTRFLAQLVAVALMIPAGLQIHTLGNLLGLGTVELGPVTGAVFTAVCAVAMINAMNMVDGLDGQAGGLALVALGLFAYAAWWSGDAAALGMSLTIGGALAVFQAVNARHPANARARVYLGDAGSTLLGFWLVCFAVDLGQPGPDAPRALAPIVVVWILAVPLLEVMTSTVRRLAQGRSPLAPDRGHVHHLLLAGGLRHGQVATLRCTLALLLGGAGLFGWRAGVPEAVLAYGFVALWMAHLAWVIVTARRHGAGGHAPGVQGGLS